MPAANIISEARAQQCCGFLHRGAFLFKRHAAVMQPPHIQTRTSNFPARGFKIIHQHRIALREHGAEQGSGRQAARGE